MCKHINEHWNNEHLKRLVNNTSLYLIFRLGIILTTCLRAGTVWPILRRKWKTLSGSRVNTTGFQMPRKAQHRVQTHWGRLRYSDRNFQIRTISPFLLWVLHVFSELCGGVGCRGFLDRRGVRCLLFIPLPKWRADGWCGLCWFSVGIMVWR